MSLVPPGSAALCCSRGDDVSVGNKGRVDGSGAAGALFPASTGTPGTTGSAELIGSPAYGTVSGYSATWSSVFGVSVDELKSLATVRLTSGDHVPNPFPEYGLVFCEGNLTVNQTYPLKGTGLLVVDGNLTIAANSGSYFNGIIYVTGNYSQLAPSMIRGSVIVLGDGSVQGGSDVAELVYDGDVISRLLQEIGTYRIARSLRRIDADLLDGVR
jgi:hypothetical protein